MYCSNVQRRMVEKVATLEAEKPALSAASAEDVVTVDSKRAVQLHLAEKSPRSMQSADHKALGVWQTSESVSPLAPAALEAGETVSVAEKSAAMSAVESSPDKRPSSFDYFEELMQTVIEQKGLGWEEVTVEDVKRLYPPVWQGLKGLADDAKVAIRTSTMNNSALSTPSQQRAIRQQPAKHDSLSCLDDSCLDDIQWLERVFDSLEALDELTRVERAKEASTMARLRARATNSATASSVTKQGGGTQAAKTECAQQADLVKDIATSITVEGAHEQIIAEAVRRPEMSKLAMAQVALARERARRASWPTVSAIEFQQDWRQASSQRSSASTESSPCTGS